MVQATKQSTDHRHARAADAGEQRQTLRQADGARVRVAQVGDLLGAFGAKPVAGPNYLLPA
ncbi:Uncharacterised protein [Mycobacteroides abscessus subsp. abscessus]|nr:Uncharacterised protein [Mycobacteroides abscessus subsp. abscessus]